MMEANLEALAISAKARIEAAVTAEELEAVRVEVLGRKGALANISKEMAKMTPERRAAVGKLLNAAKQALEGAFDAKKTAFDGAALTARLESEWVDLTIPAPAPGAGSMHPLSRIQAEIEDLFVSLGFAVLDGPEVESDEHNFDALNIPADHPARDMQDTFWLQGGWLLRTHTSPVQVRGMRKFGPPLRMIAPGRVFRNEEVDASQLCSSDSTSGPSRTANPNDTNRSSISA